MGDFFLVGHESGELCDMDGTNDTRVDDNKEADSMVTCVDGETTLGLSGITSGGSTIVLLRTSHSRRSFMISSRPDQTPLKSL